jgi:hypothetical protein
MERNVTASPMPRPSAPTPPEVVHTFKLSNGQTVEVIRAKGKHQRLAVLAAGSKPDQVKLLWAMIAQLIRMDGKPVPFETFYDMDLADVLEIQEEVADYVNPRRAKGKGKDESESSLDQPLA